jgi:hypothetical protein
MTPKAFRTLPMRYCRRFAFPMTILASMTALAANSLSQARAAETAKCALNSTLASAEAVSSAIDEASRRFHVPSKWIRAVMRAESHSDACAVSVKGAVGLMQIMPATYQELRLKHVLGPEPFNPGDNILAGAAYLSAMFERYGEGGFLAAYNAGPKRYEEYLHGRPLPTETIDYVAGLASRLSLEELPATEVPAFADMGRASIFVNVTELNSARQIARNSATSAGTTIGEAVPHPLFPAQRDDKIFARVSLSDGGSIARLRVVQHSPADIFVARSAR